MRAILILVGALSLGFTVLYYTSEGRQDRLQYDEARQRWHHDCDAYVGRAVASEDATSCQERLHAMMAYAKQRGW